MNTKIKVGIIGFGVAGRDMHYRALVEGLDDMVEVIAVYNRSEIPRKGRNEGDFPVDDSVAIYTDLEAFLKHPGLEVVHVTTPSGLHKEYIVKAAKARKHVICDKPLEVTLVKADESIEACEENGVALAVSFQQRFNSHLTKLKDAVMDGCLGEIISGAVETKLYRVPEYYTESSWHGKLDLDGGAALMNQGIHYIDLLQWLADSPVAEITKGMTGRLIHTYIEAEDFGYGELKLENGAELTILGGTCFRPGIDQRLEIRGTDGWVSVVDGIVTQAIWAGKDHKKYFGAVERVAASSSSPTIGLENHIRFFRATYEAISEGKDVPVSGREARKATEIILGIYKAHETGSPVNLPFESTYTPQL